MNSIQFPEVNLNLGAGDNPNTNDLPVAVVSCEYPGYENIAFLVSCFKPTPEELARINETGVIWLSIMCPKPIQDIAQPLGKMTMTGTQPPILISAENPLKEFNPPYVAYPKEAFTREGFGKDNNAEPSASGENEKEDTNTGNDRVHEQQ